MRKLQVLGGYPKKIGEAVIKAVLGVDKHHVSQKSENLF